MPTISNDLVSFAEVFILLPLTLFLIRKTLFGDPLPYEILDLLDGQSESVPLDEIASHVRQPTQTLIPLLEAMAKEGLIRTDPDNPLRRSITPTGRLRLSPRQRPFIRED